MASGVVCGGLDGCRFEGCLQRNASFLGSGGRSLTPQKKIYLPARLGPGSRGVVPETVSGRLLGRPLEAATVPRWLDKLPRWFLERFGSHCDPNLGSSWARLGTPRGPNMQYTSRFFDVFAYSRLSAEDAQYDPKSNPRVPQETPRGSQERPTGAQEEPNTAPGRPQDDPSHVKVEKKTHP